MIVTMARTLVLMRHGKSDYPAGVADVERPLAERGRREAALAGVWMADDGLSFDHVICSSATRTRETLDATGITAPTDYADSIYAATAEQVCETIRELTPPDASTVLVVGHEPGMPDTALTLDPHAQITRFPTSTYAVLTVTASWDRLGLSADDESTLVAVRVPRDD